MGDSEILARSEHFPDNLISSLQRLRGDGKFCDVTIKCADTEFKAHKTVLASATEYFEAMFSNETKESRTGIVDFSHMPVAVVKQSLDFIYSGKVEISVKTVNDMLNLSEMIQIQELSRLCVEFRAERIDLKNCAEIIALSNLHSKEYLSDKIGTFLVKNFEEFIEKDTYKSLEIGCVLHCLDLLQVTASGRMSEIQKWNAVLSWIDYDPDQRKDQFFKLFKTVDLSCLSKDFLKEKVLPQPLVNQSNECLALVAIGSVLDQHRPVQKRVDFKGFLYFRNDSQMIVRFELKSGKWLPPVTFPGIFTSAMDIISHHNSIYVGDGASLYQLRDGKWNVTSPTVNYIDKSMSQVSEQMFGRCYSRCVGIGNNVYMVTRYFIFQCDTTDLSSNSYKLPMSLAIDFFIAASEERIYIMNSDGVSLVFDLSTKVCSYISRHDRWNYGFAMWYDHRLYVFSYNRSDNASSDFHIYDPRSDTWTLIPEFKTAGIVHNYYIADKLYLIGKSHEDIRDQVDLEYLKSINVEAKDRRCSVISN